MCPEYIYHSNIFIYSYLYALYKTIDVCPPESVNQYRFYFKSVISTFCNIKLFHDCRLTPSILKGISARLYLMYSKTKIDQHFISFILH